jgi:uncharacterized protein YdhG (YjbR/CyaY superfamily)
MTYWFDQMKERSDWKYPEQIAFLREEHGFSRTHANALVLHCRGSKSARRFETLDDYLEQFDTVKQATVRKIFRTLQKTHPKLESVIAWNHPMLKYEDAYVFGLSVHSQHILLAPWSASVFTDFAGRLADYGVNKKTFKVPIDWDVDADLLRDLIDASIREIDR